MKHQVVDILGDQGDRAFPIYRDNTPPDEGSTLSTALFDLDNGIMSVYCFANPKSSAPVMVVDLARFP